MELPRALSMALESRAQSADRARLIMAARELSERYRTRTGTGERLLTRDDEALAYALTRMPATHCAVRAALSWALECFADRRDIHTLLDAGAGTGAAVWAAMEALNLGEITCLEREAAMRRLGEELMREAKGADNGASAHHEHSCAQNPSAMTALSGPPAITWLARDLTDAAPLPRADLVIASYVLGEQTDALRLSLARRLLAAADKLLLIVEPGTPDGWARLMALRRELSARGGRVIAPCPHEQSCPIAGEDRCHFSVRVARTKTHRQLKGADAPYEDEKFCYLALARAPITPESLLAPAGARVLRHPYIGGGFVRLRLCTARGIIDETITKKQGEAYKRARKVCCGDVLSI